MPSLSASPMIPASGGQLLHPEADGLSGCESVVDVMHCSSGQSIADWQATPFGRRARVRAGRPVNRVQRL
jgi:hypothetical protein